MNTDTVQLLAAALEALNGWQSSYGAQAPDSSLNSGSPDVEKILLQLAEKLTGNYPFHHSSYAGQMLKPPHPIAWAAYALAMAVNPNNHALDGGPPTSALEKEVIAILAKMVGYADGYMGHLTSSGTIANLEALWVARCLHPGKAIAFSSAAHYTHRRMCEVLGIEAIEIATDVTGVMDVAALQSVLPRVGTVVVTLGTTGLGCVEPLHTILTLCHAAGVRVHVDAAYGGFFKLLVGTGMIDDSAWMTTAKADSIVIDPHKHGLQPYGCGCVLFQDAAVGRFYKHDSPYTYFSSAELHLGEISLECSRAGASAAALWATLQLLPLTRAGLGAVLAQCRRAALAFHAALAAGAAYIPLGEPSLDILAYYPAVEVRSLSAISAASQRVFAAGMQLPPNSGFHLSLYTMDAEAFSLLHPGYEKDAAQVTILRSVLLKPEHATFVPELVARLERAATV